MKEEKYSPLQEEEKANALYNRYNTIIPNYPNHYNKSPFILYFLRHYTLHVLVLCKKWANQADKLLQIYFVVLKHFRKKKYIFETSKLK